MIEYGRTAPFYALRLVLVLRGSVVRGEFPLHSGLELGWHNAGQKAMLVAEIEFDGEAAEEEIGYVSAGGLGD